MSCSSKKSCCEPEEQKAPERKASKGCCSAPEMEKEPQGCCSTAERDEESQDCCAAPRNSHEEMEPVVIHKDMTIEEILSCFPEKGERLAQEITSAGLHCVGCHAATYETLEAGMLGHGMTLAEVASLVDKLNKVLEEKQDLTTITLTAKAAEKYQEILADEGKIGWGLRFSERMAGCSGFEYTLDYSEKATEDDEIFLSSGVEIHVQKKMVKRLLGCSIDFVDGLHSSGFKISNPNVRASCHCGTSHGY